MANQVPNEFEIFIPPGNELRNRQVVYLNAKACRPTGLRRLDRNKPILPSFRQHGRFHANTVGVITEGPMERRALADRSFDQIPGIRVGEGKYVGFHRLGKFLGYNGVLAENGLRTDHDKLIQSGDPGRCSQNVLKLLSLHGVYA